MTGIAFPRRHLFGGHCRLRRPEQFSAVFSARRTIRTETFELLYRPNGESGARLGLVIGKKFARRAVMRNLVKRMARESFRHARSGLAPMDLVLRLRRTLKGPLGCSGRRALRSEIDGLLGRLPV